MKRIFIIFIFMLSGIFVLAQTDSTIYVEYSPDFIFNEGIYLDFNQVKNNDPIPKTRILSNDNINDFNFLKNLVEKEMIFYYNDLGMRQEIKTDKVWGFSRNGTLFINYNGNFNRIPVVGSICHFISNITVVTERYYDRFNDPFYFDRSYGGYYNSPNYYRSYPSRTSKNEMRQYLLDFETGEVIAYDRGTVEILLMKDPDIYDEYHSLKRRKKKQLKFFYLRKYNEKHPLFFPVTK